MDSLYINVPSLTVDEDGYLNIIMLKDNKIVSFSKTNEKPDCIYEEISGCLMAAPKPLLETDTDPNVTAKWTSPTSHSFKIMDIAATRKGVQVSEYDTNKWTIKSVSDTLVECNRGFFIDFQTSGPPSDSTNLQKPIIFYWGKFKLTDTDYKFKVELFTNELGAANCTVYERNKLYSPTTPGSIEWKPLEQLQIVAKDFYGSQHRLWIEPLSDKTFLIKNMNSSLGAVITTLEQSEHEFDIPVAHQTQSGPTKETVKVTWEDSSWKTEGTSITWFCLRNLEYKNTFEVFAPDYIDLGYTSTKAFNTELKLYLPDGLGDKSAYDYDTYIYNQNGVIWSAPTGGNKFWWDLEFTGPGDGSSATYSKRTPKLSHLKFKLAKGLSSNGLVAVDLFANPLFCIESLEETRSQNDEESTMSFSVTATKAAFDYYLWPKINGRVQWVIDFDGIYYVRFDGLIDTISGPKFVDFSSNTYLIKYNIVCKGRFKDFETSIFRGSYSLDSMKRSEVYQLIAEQANFDASEIVIDPNLLNDIALPSANDSEKPSLMTKIGTNCLDVIKEVQEYYSVNDLIYFRDDGAGSTKLYISNPSSSLKATFYRDAITANLNLSPTTVIATTPGSNAMTIQVNDKNFYNDFWIIGGDAGKQLFASHYEYSPSWRTPTDPLYIKNKKTVIIVNPAWNSQSIVNVVGYSLFKKYCKFSISLTIESFLYPSLYPGDVIAIHPGGEPGATLNYFKVISMSTKMEKLLNPSSRRYRCVYELEEY